MINEPTSTASLTLADCFFAHPASSNSEAFDQNQSRNERCDVVIDLCPRLEQRWSRMQP